ncbi:MAG: hypothetical protein SVP26_01710 [Chloroflexota bacterium]|nr:hypothetical protein [Chloroflexota bacterium]
MGVRSLSCLVEAGERVVVIDPGVALGYRRYGLLPHPVQAAASEAVQSAIVTALGRATDVVISHFHGDHHPLVDANPYQLPLERVVELLRTPRLWTKGTHNVSHVQVNRAEALGRRLGRTLPVAEGAVDGPLSFSASVPHGKPGPRNGTVMMTRIEDASAVFVHASDIQMLSDEAIETIVAWQPSIVLASGPPLHRSGLTPQTRDQAMRRALHLANHVDALLLDHHLMRSREGEEWLNRLSARTTNRVTCAADFMHRPRLLLEADRVEWYHRVPVPRGWHRAYARGEASARRYRHYLDGDPD